MPRIKQKQLSEPISPLLLQLSPPFPLYAPECTCSHMPHSQTHAHTESHPHPPHCFQSSKTPSSSPLTIAVPSERNALLPALHLTSASLGPWFKCKDLREAFLTLQCKLPPSHTLSLKAHSPTSFCNCIFICQLV